MTDKPRKILLLIWAAALLAGVHFTQSSMNVDRERLGVLPLENAPPVLAFTTVALGGFRGLISNALWIRAMDLQDEDKFFEMAQLADWITKLEPHYVQVWLVEAWNMAYNISVKFSDYSDRWRWVQRGIELLRDEGIPLNPNETLIYRELAWFFQHKMGANLDDASMLYKQQWANEMAQVFGKLRTPNLDELINPQTPDQRARVKLLREKYKMDPLVMKEVDTQYGPLEWRLPEAHAIYWAYLGLRKAAENPSKIKPDDLITLRRVIYQSMQLSFQRGRLVANPFEKAFEFGPNLEIIPKVSAAYEQAAQEDQKNRDHILRAHKNLLKDAVYFLYEYNRNSDAAYWFKYLGEKYPKEVLIDSNTNSFPGTVTLDEYALSRIQEDVSGTPTDRIKGVIEGLLVRSYRSMVVEGEEAHAAGYKGLAGLAWRTFMSKVARDAVRIPPFAEMDREVLQRILDPDRGASPEVRAMLRTKLGLGPEPPRSSPATNAPLAQLPSQ
jgi:hypothetical protein